MVSKTIQDLLIEELRDIYHAENQLVKALPKLSRAVNSQTLRQAFLDHAEQTKGQVERLERVFEKLGTRARGKRCAAMEGLLDEAHEIPEMGLGPEVSDAAMITAAQKIEHYEIASYGSLHAYAMGCGLKEVAELLEETLSEEKEADRKLNTLAVEEINRRALSIGTGKAA